MLDIGGGEVGNGRGWRRGSVRALLPSLHVSGQEVHGITANTT